MFLTFLLNSYHQSALLNYNLRRPLPCGLSLSPHSSLSFQRDPSFWVNWASSLWKCGNAIPLKNAFSSSVAWLPLPSGKAFHRSRHLVLFFWTRAIKFPLLLTTSQSISSHWEVWVISNSELMLMTWVLLLSRSVWVASPPLLAPSLSPETTSPFQRRKFLLSPTYELSSFIRFKSKEWRQAFRLR